MGNIFCSHGEQICSFSEANKIYLTVASLKNAYIPNLTVGYQNQQFTFYSIEAAILYNMFTCYMILSESISDVTEWAYE